MNMTLHNRASYTLMAAVSLALSACSGGSGGSGGNNGPSSDNTTTNDDSILEATLLAPLIADPVDGSPSASLVSFNTRMTECKSVPEGYAPLQQTTVIFLDDIGNIIPAPTTITDDCGFFSSSVPEGASKISADSDGNKTLVAGISAIQNGSQLASTIPEDANYTISFLNAPDASTLGFSVTDDISNKAVIGLSTDAFTVRYDDEAVAIDSISTGFSTDQASIVMVMDASGSMDLTATTDPATNISYSRLNLSSRAAHQFLDQKSPDDEIAMAIFENEVHFMNKQTLDELVPLEDDEGELFDYPFPESGFTQEAAQMRLLVDAYDDDNQIWGPDNKFPRHPDTPQNASGSKRYPWIGATAFYAATIEASVQLKERDNPRKFIVAMTDGRNNRLEKNLQYVIDVANENRTPVYTIGFELGENDDLTRLASETGATAYTADSLQISDAFNSIQTTILFQYVATMPTQATSPTDIELAVDIDLDGSPEDTRRITIMPPVVEDAL